MKIKQSSRRQFLLKGVSTLSASLLLKACQKDSSSTQEPTPVSLVDPSQYLQFISVPPAQGRMPAGLIVCLHGNGSTPEFMASFAPALNLPQYHLLFPRAPFSHPTVPGGKMWYDLTIQNSKPQIENYQRLAESRQRLTNWLKSLQGSFRLPLSRTILSGLSQGGAMTLAVGLTLPLAGLVSLSGYLHPNSTSNLMGKNSFPPVLVVHGRQDQIIPLSEAELVRNTLSDLGVNVNYQLFDIGHEITPQVLAVMRNFVLETMP
ncbi:alpha/beta hydrolase [Allocoleopsis franciscana]|uniref:Putative esterase n=1 Tax=Allocoleopsis franciscana PCC 7113 TaxID=1173027 RepID=K9WIV5_9CYAN|nr:esterase [Allocoleopsis franciscana]AFZ20345.1 putative esterase [Allocoleopsis franciscana PCC 7113]